MRAVVQRVTAASVVVEGEVVGQIGRGLLVLVGVGQHDTDADRAYLAQKLIGLRIFADDNGQMNHSVADIGGSVLLVSQFTLYGDVRKGRRPSFVAAMAPGPAEACFAALVADVAALGVPVQTGRFGADMQVALTNDGPVTILLDSTKVL